MKKGVGISILCATFLLAIDCDSLTPNELLSKNFLTTKPQVSKFDAKTLFKKRNFKNLESSSKLKPEYDPNTIIVEFRNKNFSLINSELQKMGVKAKVLKSLSNHSDKAFAIVKVQQGQNPKNIIKKLKQNPLVKSIQYNYIKKKLALPNDPLFVNQWHLDGADNNAIDINVQSVWDTTTGSDDVVVAIFDTGLSIKHEDLEDNVWVNEAELNGEPGKDDDGNGYVDDVYGYDFATDMDGNNGPLYGDVDSHGTHVAGIIGAVGNNSVGVSGVNWKVKILPVKVFRPSLGAYDSDILEAIDYILLLKDKGVNIVAVNASYGGFGGDADNSPMKDAIEALGEKGIVFFAAAGNSGIDNDLIYYDIPALPASYNVDNLVAVAATDENQNLTYFSQYGKKTVQVGAPGINILSTTDFIDGNDTNAEDFEDGFENGGDNWSASEDGWSITDAKAHQGTYSVTDSPDGNYDDSSNGFNYIFTKEIDLSSEKGNQIAVDLCYQSNLGNGDIMFIALYNGDDSYVNIEYTDSSSTGDNWKCVGVPIPEYYKTSTFRVLIGYYHNGDGNSGDGVYFDDVKIGTFTHTNTYEAWAGTSMATPVVTGTYALLSSVNDEDIYSKISRIIGNGDKVNLPIMGTVENVYNIVNNPTPPFIFGTKKVMSISGDSVTIKVANAGNDPTVWLGDEKAKTTKVDGDNITFEISDTSKREVVVQNNDINSSNKLYLSKWQMLSKMPNQHSLGLVAGEYNGKIYIAGGIDTMYTGNYTDIDVYNIKNDSWDSITPDSDEAKIGNTGALVNGKLYLIGGNDLNGDNETVKYYDIEKGEWVYGANLPKTIYYSKAIVFGDYIGILGGFDDDGNTLSDVYAYDTKNDQIIELASMNEKRVAPAICTFKNKVYVFGGWNGNDVVDTAEVYDVNEDSWKYISKLPGQWIAGECVNVNDEYILLFGGVDGDFNAINVIAKYYPDEDKYEVYENTIYQNILSRFSLAGKHLVKVDNELYYFGGYHYYLYGTYTSEKIELPKVEEKMDNDIKEPIDDNTTTQDENQDDNSSGDETSYQDYDSASGSVPLFDVFSFLILIGSILLIYRRK